MNLADPRSVQKSKQAARLQRQRQLDDLKAVASTFQGRRFLKRILDETAMFGLYFDGANLGMNAFYEGRRSLGVVLFNDLNEVDPLLYAKLVKEEKANQPLEPQEEGDSDVLYHPKAHVTIPKQEDDDARDID